MRASVMLMAGCCVAPAALAQPGDEQIAKLLMDNTRVRVYEVLLQPGQ